MCVCVYVCIYIPIYIYTQAICARATFVDKEKILNELKRDVEKAEAGAKEEKERVKRCAYMCVYVCMYLCM